MSRPGEAAALLRPHVFVAGTGGPPLLLLHGTGGSEDDLLELGRALAPDAPLLSPRGLVVENGMARFFARDPAGAFDEDDLRARADELAVFVRAASRRDGTAEGTLVAVGFSNGANTASALAFRHPGLLRGLVLIGSVPPFRDGPGEVDLTGTAALVVNGRRDPIVPAAATDTLVAQLGAAGADVTRLDHAGGHTVPGRLVPRIADAVAALA